MRYKPVMRPVLALLLSSVVAFSVASDVGIVGTKVAKPPTIDGNLTPEEWSGLPSAEGFVDEQTGKQAEKGTFWLGYDDKYIYFAARIDTNPATIRATEYRTNVSLRSDDAVYLGVDAFGTGNELNIFGINSRGATDIRIAGGRAAKREWLGEFSANARKIDTGYEVEARIPWGLMRLPSPGKRDVRVLVARYDPKTQRDTFWVYMPNGNSDIPFWRGVEVPRSGNDRSLKLLPYGYGGFSEKDHIANAGLDLKTSLTDRIDAVGTINPDFRNIENQILSLDFSYFERLAGESRPFFLEGNQYFQTSRDAPLFASQRIQKFDAGFKTFGQITDKTNFAVLNTIDFGERNNFVGNVRHRLGPNASVAGAVTTVTDRSGSDNVATYLSADASKNGLGVFGQHMTTRDTASGGGHRYNTGFFYQKGGWEGNLEYVEVSPGFLPRLGFAPERNLKGFATSGGYVHTIPKGSLMEWGFDFGARDYKRFDRSQYRTGVEFGGSLTWRNGVDFDFGAQVENFQGSKDRLYYFSLEHPRGDSYRHWQVDYVTGDISGQKYDAFNLGVAYRPIERLQLSLSGQEVHHFDRDTQLIFGANYDIGKEESVSGRMVRRGRDINAYLAFRKSGGRGAEYFLILGDPNARTWRTSLVLKVVLPFEVKF